MTTHTHALRLASLALLVATAAACHDDTTGAAATDPGGAGDPAVAFADLPPDEIVTTAKAAIRDSGALFLERDLTVDGVRTYVSVHLDDDGNCLGSIQQDGGTAQILGVEGTTWFKPDEEFWRATAPEAADAIIDEVGDRWVLTTALDGVCDLDHVFEDQTVAPDREVETLGLDEVDGEQVVQVRSAGADGVSSVASILTAAPHHLVRLDVEGATAGAVYLDGFGQAVATQPPASEEQVTQDELDALP